jgi:hypothetical protein
MIFRTQPRVPLRQIGDDGGAQHKGAAGGARRAPASSYGRHTARGRPQATRATSSPPREAPALLHDEGETAVEENRRWRRRPRV